MSRLTLFDLLVRILTESAFDEICREGGFTRDDLRAGRVEIVDGKLRRRDPIKEAKDQ